MQRLEAAVGLVLLAIALHFVTKDTLEVALAFLKATKFCARFISVEFISLRLISFVLFPPFFD